MSTGLGRRVGGETAKGLADPIFCALALSIGSAVDGKNVGAREDVGDDLDSFFDPNFRNMECLFMIKGVVPKLAAGERVTVVMVKALFGRCRIGRVFDQTKRPRANWDPDVYICAS